MPITLHMGVDEYYISNGSDESDPVQYGDPCVLQSRGKVYIAMIEETDDGDRVSLLDPDAGTMVFEGKLAKSAVEEYDEREDDDETEDGGDDDDDDGDGQDSDDGDGPEDED